MDLPKGFMGALFDFSFSSFVTPKIIKILYILMIIIAGLYALIIPITLFQQSAIAGVIGLVIGTPLLFFFMLVFSRIYTEMIIVIFRAAEALIEVQKRGRRQSGSS